MKRWLAYELIVILAVLVLLPGGCQPLEKSVRDAIAAEKGFLDKAEQNHLAECQASPTKSLCLAIRKAGEARNVAIDILELYCSGLPRSGGKSFAEGGPCAPDKSAEPKLRAALADLQRDIADLKAVLSTSPPASSNPPKL